MIMDKFCTKIQNENNKLKNIQRLDQDKTNKLISIDQILKNRKDFLGNKKAKYFPYNYQFIDLGWGCAWRAIQMVLSGYQIEISFRDLFQKYSRKKVLMEILIKNQLYNEQNIKIVAETKFSPGQVPNNWAQPFIGKLICQDFNIKSQLFLLNGYPNANAPRQVFQKVYDFSHFLKFIKQNIQLSPIMIDDGLLSMAIISYKQISQNEHIFVIGDPHVFSNRTNSNVGIYEITFNQNGDQISHKATQQDLKQAYLDSISATQFKNKKWMCLVTFGKKII